MTESIKLTYRPTSTSNTIYENDSASTEEDCETTSCHADIKIFDDYEWRTCCDLTNLPVLSEEHLLHCLKERYSVDSIYTQMKNHIISINPCRPIPEMYSKEKMEKLEKAEAHIFNLGQMTLDRLISKRSSAECIVISGESGSGKTECCRYLLRYLINLSIQNHQISDQKAQFVEKRLLQANPVLEAFGNAPTCHNRNSSRFGKFIQLLYHPTTGMLLGGRIQIYLLEKTRILHLRSNKGEPFHVFHAMSTMSAADRTRFHLETELPWCQVTPFITWDGLMESMVALGIEPENRHRITAILSALVLLSRLNFELAPVNSKRNHHTENPLTIGQENHARLSRISELLGTRAKLLITSLTENKFSSRRESVYIRSCTLEEAMSRVDTLMKLIYQLLFECIIKQANKNICSDADNHLVGDSKEALSLGLLDMYGFECLQTNSLEQLCINYANEKLQRYFVESILLATKLEYEQEEVPFQCGDLNSISQGEVTVFLERHMFTILEEECRMQRRGITAARLATRLRAEVQPKFPSILTKLTPSDGLKVEMCVRHYAGQVNYDLSNFLEQNADRVPADLFNLLTESSQGQWLLRDQSTCSLSTFVNSYKRRPAVCTQFRDAVVNLVHRLDASEVHFVRCVKPFADAGLVLSSDAQRKFDVNFVRQQLHSCGVMDTIRVCRAAVHPVRIKYEEFHRRYKCLFSSLVKQRQNCATSTSLTVDSPSVYVDLEKRFREQHRLPSTPPRSSTRSVRRRTGASEMDQQRRVCVAISHMCLTSGNGIQADQFGRHLLFLTQEQSDNLEAATLALHHHAACILQSTVRSWLTRLIFLRMRCATVKIQRCIRKWLVFRRQRRRLCVEDVRNRSASVIQRWVRRWLLVKRLKTKRTEDCVREECAAEKLLCVEGKPRSPIKKRMSSASSTRKHEELTEGTNKFQQTTKKHVKDHETVNPSFSIPSDLLSNHSNRKSSTDCNFFRENGILSCRYIPKPEKMHLSTDDSRRHRLLPYSNVRPLYHGCPVISSYRISITNCL